MFIGVLVIIIAGWVIWGLMNSNKGVNQSFKMSNTTLGSEILTFTKQKKTSQITYNHLSAQDYVRIYIAEDFSMIRVMSNNEVNGHFNVIKLHHTTNKGITYLTTPLDLTDDNATDEDNLYFISLAKDGSSAVIVDIKKNGFMFK